VCIDRGVHVITHGLHHLAAAEGQQLHGQRGGAIGRLEHLFGAATQWIERRKIVEDHAVVAGDHGQHIVEIVRHAARQPSHGFHFLRL
jgi:hypothetical protein